MVGSPFAGLETYLGALNTGKHLTVTPDLSWNQTSADLPNIDRDTVRYPESVGS